MRAFKNADILLPREGIDLPRWSVVACDQYTSEPEYWKKVEEFVGMEPSTFKMILPEVYLEGDDILDRLRLIKESMQENLMMNTYKEYKNAMIYVERTDSSGKVRAGIVGAIDLEQYDFRRGSTSLVRATEATVLERIPPRIKVRSNAEVELPHIMILIDDEDKTVIEPMAEAELPVIYDFDLMMGGGHLKGALMGEKEQEQVLKTLDLLGQEDTFAKKYGLEDMPVLLYAMGDGNHSLATAKEFYEQLKREHPDQDLSNHPARYALVELVNLHSPALEFEAIHRILTQVDAAALMEKMTEELGMEEVSSDETEGQVLQVVLHGEKTTMRITKPTSKLTVGSLQSFLDQYLADNGGKIDYIHGIDVLCKLSMQEDSIGFILYDMGKEELFPTVILDGALPRKTFSMGHAEDKRFYMECRKIVED